MRIISGKNKGRQIIAPANLPVRPTTDLGKESLFNILNNYFFFDRVTVLDLFAGTGNITYEFASREAPSVTAIDNNGACVDFINKTIHRLDYHNVAAIKSDAFLFTSRCRQQFDIIFADPPYDLEGIEQIIEHVFTNQLLKPNGWLVMEHSKTHNFSTHPNFYEHRSYGKLNFSFFVEGIEKNMTNNEIHN
jgi:16S rRNA (guanine(966)-N(2))-methyltransferase RsmD